MIITDFLEKNAWISPDMECLVEINPTKKPEHIKTWKEFSLIEPIAAKQYRRSITWDDFNRSANRCANMLLSKGVKKGTKVGILLMNCLEWLPIYFGILKTGALAVPMNYRFSGDEISYCVDLADIDYLFYGKEFIERIESVKNDIKRVKELIYVGEEVIDGTSNYLEQIKYYTSKKPIVELKEDDDAAIYFSSGTTGFPKAILHTHLSLVSACETEQNHHGQTKDDVFLCIPPLYHTGAKMHWFGSLLSGSKAVLLRGVKPEWIFHAVSEERATIVWLLVPWAQDILDSIDNKTIDLKEYDLEQWRLMHIGAQPVPHSLIERWMKIFPHHQYDTNYGLSESIGPGCVHLGVENINKVGSIGIPGYKWEAKIVDELGKEVTTPEEVGELAVKGRGVMKCYYKNPKATSEILKDGWLYTGDMAKKDKDGFIYLVDRKKDVIITGGENLYPVQIEDFLRSNDKIKDVAVIGLPDDRLGEIAAAIIEVKENMELTSDEVMEFCDNLPRYKRPRKIIFAKVPRNATGKIEKPKLREIYGGGKLLVEAQTTK